MKLPVILSWSGGKDSAYALHKLRLEGKYEVVGLLTSLSQEFLRVSHHGVRESLLDDQAKSLGLPLEKIYFPSDKSHPCTHGLYERMMGEKMDLFKSRGIQSVAFGDLFLEDLRAWREQNLAKADMTAVFPIWKTDTTQLSQEVIAAGFRAYLSCVEPKVGEGFAGRAYDADLLRDLPEGIDPCGEYGEFHTFVYDGPVFDYPLKVQVGEIVVKEGRYYADIMEAG